MARVAPHLAPRWLLALSLSLSVALTAGLLGACERSSPRAAVSPATGPTPAAAGECPVVITIEASGTRSRPELVVRAENRDARVHELVLPSRCPEGPLELRGLPAGYDYYGTCVMGACPGDLPPTRVGLGVGDQRELARIPVELGANTCNEAVPPGEYSVTAVVPGVDPACITGVTVAVAGRPRPVQPAPEPAPTPAPSPSPHGRVRR